MERLKRISGTESKRQVFSSISIVAVKYLGRRGTDGTLTWENSGTVFAKVGSYSHEHVLVTPNSYCFAGTV